MALRFKNNNFIKILPVLFLVIFIILGLGFALEAKAEFNITQYILSAIIQTITYLLKLLIAFLGKLFILMMRLIVWLSLYNDFINAEAVKTGWQILRNLVNMFFILGLLLIAFATVLGIEKFSYNKLLGRLLVMAILVNFSRTICGLIIDFFQVIMLTFVNAYKDIMAGNFFQGLGVIDWFRAEPPGVKDPLVENTKADNDGIDYLVAMILGFVFVFVTFVVMLIFAVVLAVRVVGLWMLIIFSPLAFFAYAFEGTGKLGSFSQTWWTEFFNYCILGPCLAFFLWLSVAVVMDIKNNVAKSNPTGYVEEEGERIEISKAGTRESLLRFLISVMMLFGGLVFCAKFKTPASGVMTKGANYLKDRSVGRLERTAMRMGGAAYGLATAPVRYPVKGIIEGTRDMMYRTPGLRYLTSEGRKEAANLTTAYFRSIFGPRKMELERERQKLEEKDVKRLSSERVFLNPKTMQDRFNSALKRNDLRESRAILAEGARRGWIDSAMVDDFITKFGSRMKQGPLFEFTEQIGSDFKKATGRHLRTNEMYVTEEGLMKPKKDTPAQEYANAVGRMNFREQSQMAEQSKTFRSNIVDGKERNKYWKEELMAYANQIDNFGHYNPLARQNIASAIEEIVADPAKLAQFDVSERKDLNAMYEAATAPYQGRTGIRKRDPRTGKEAKGKIILSGDEYLPQGFEAAQPSEVQLATWEEQMKEIEGGLPAAPPAAPPPPAPPTAPPPAPPTAPPAPGRLGRIAERIMGPERYERLQSLIGMPSERLNEELSKNYRLGKQFVLRKLITGGMRNTMPIVPQKPKEIPGILNEAQINELMVELSSQPQNPLHENKINKKTGQYGQNKIERNEIINKIKEELQKRGIAANLAANRARQIVEFKENSFKYNQAKNVVNEDVVSEIGFAEINITPEGEKLRVKSLPELDPAQLDKLRREGASGESRTILQKGLRKLISSFTAYQKKLVRRGAELNKELVNRYEENLKRMENFVRTKADITPEQAQALVDDIETIINTIYSGVLIKE